MSRFVALARHRLHATIGVLLRRSFMFKKIILFFLMSAAAAVAGLAQDQPSLPTNRELVSKARSLYVDSDTVYMKREQLVSSLLGREEFKTWELQITNNQRLADLLVRVHRVPFSNHFIYTVTDRRTETIVMAGKVDSLAGTVYGLIADEIVHKMKTFRGDPAPQKPQQQSSAQKVDATN